LDSGDGAVAIDLPRLVGGAAARPDLHNANNLGVHFPFVSAMEKNNGTSNFTLKFGNTASGGLTTTWSGPLPTNYAPMKLQPRSCSAPAVTTATALPASSSKAP
jgi:hypothetical protein